jgi:hypothetical protein
VVTVIGQFAFLYFIVAFYVGSTLRGDFAAWNGKPLITGYVAGDTAGNLQFAIHVLGAALVTAGGAIQFIPWVRRNAPAFHRWNGRVYVTLGVVMALGGLWLVWVRGTYLTLYGATSISMVALLILWFGAMTVRNAMRRRIDLHQRWALRLFMVMSAVWFQRIGYMAWIILNAGPAGIGDNMDGPFDILWGFGIFVLPLAILELYLRVKDRGSETAKTLLAGLVLTMTAVMIVGIGGATMFMWLPYL